MKEIYRACLRYLRDKQELNDNLRDINEDCVLWGILSNTGVECPQGLGFGVHGIRETCPRNTQSLLV